MSHNSKVGVFLAGLGTGAIIASLVRWGRQGRTMPIDLRKPNLAALECLEAGYPGIVGALRRLLQTFVKALPPTTNADVAADRVVWGLGHASGEDFKEMLVLCSNRCGLGAMKVMRGMYERTVTQRYIAIHPDEAQAFLDYHSVHQRKAFRHLQAIPEAKALFSAKQIQDIESNYEAVKGKFQETLCDKCGTLRTQISWSQLDIAAMARKAGNGLDTLYASCYYFPTILAHSTVSSVGAYVRGTEDDEIAFESDAQAEHVTGALIGGCCLMLHVLDTQNTYFKLGLDKEIQDREADLKAFQPAS